MSPASEFKKLLPLLIALTLLPAQAGAVLFRWRSDVPYHQEYPSAGLFNESELMVSQGFVCNANFIAGSNICSKCGCVDYWAVYPRNCTTPTRADLLECIASHKEDTTMYWGSVPANTNITSSWGCHNLGMTDRSIRYRNPLFRHKVWSAWFKRPTGTFTSLLPSPRVVISLGQQRQQCDALSELTETSVQIRVGLRLAPRAYDTGCVGGEPMETVTGKLVVESGTVWNTLHFRDEIYRNVKLIFDTPYEFFIGAAALGKDEYFAIDVSWPDVCDGDALEPYMRGDMYRAYLVSHVTYVWIIPNRRIVDCCLIKGDASVASAFLNETDIGWLTQQWVRDGGMMKGIKEDLCVDELRGRIILASEDVRCANLNYGDYLKTIEKIREGQ